ncbi:N-acetylglucosamine kinase [Vibrio palustris]|uniref:N-acetyl-D-glucosamine kinase n=1 Tax=Vibrio palustris TaxID=1918946 RepID=A0A1R4B2I0_9VIBR|nr:N-acetylglucosamine kinase [Vibrio palustris]SJL83130.1 N-acetyl-D-glucosamine kinase [Vibrio palustris]
MYYGLDIGGTKIEFGAFNKKLERVAKERIATNTEDYEQLINSIVDLVEQHDKKFGEEGTIGIGLPGMENAKDGTMLTVNIPAANGQPLRQDLQDKLKRKVSVENDANCFALSEAWDDEFQGKSTVLGLIMGTGFGGGLIINGQVISGSNHVAGEVGHTRVPIDAWLALGDNPPLLDCGCGKQGCLDNYLSGRGFELLYTHFYDKKCSAQDIITAYHCDDMQAKEFVDRYLEFTAMCFGGLFTALDPAVVVIGGGLSNFDTLYEELPKRIPRYLMSVASCPQIIKARYGDSGGVRGAAFLNLPLTDD